MGFKEYFYQFIKEDSIENIGFEGDWSDEAKPRGWDRPSIGILKNDKGIEKLKTKWQKTRYPFDLWFVRSPKGFKYTEVGKVDFAFVRDKLGMNIPLNDDHITVIYTNNKGSEKMPATPWTLAHRFGHAIRMGNPMYQQLNKRVENIIHQVADKVYGRDTKENNFYDPHNQNDRKRKIQRQVAHSLGTFKSARDKNLRNVGEFTNELVAQYIISDKIQFNRAFPKILATSFAWGNPQGPWMKNMTDEQKEELEDILYAAESEIYYLIDDLVGNAVGSIYVM
jgi:hypothetical protein